jgi:DtxR family Mn-dependent transcriptional regulator
MRPPNIFKNFKLMFTLTIFMVSINLTKEQEDYINAVYELQDTLSIAKIVHLSRILNYSPGAINDEMKRLEKKGYVIRIPYRGFRLSQDGMEVARITVRKHRISEAFLFHILDVPWERCHLLSMEIEHSISGDLEKYIIEKIKDNKKCPHGNSFDINEDTKDLRLVDAELGKEYTVKRISYEESSTLFIMRSYGIIPGKKIRVLSRDKHGVMVSTENGDFHLEGIYEMAVRINE